MSDLREADAGLTHLDSEGRPKMVDVSGKRVTGRWATAEGSIRMTAATLGRLVGGGPKGDAVRVAELAGIQAAKRTHDLIPLCHLLPAVSVGVEVTPDEALPGLRVRAVARVQGSTGVEMEALTAVSVALLTLYDMGKAVDRRMVLGDIRLTGKAGGRSGVYKVDTASAQG
ncbi:MAG: cyclic pyranopterin monophosphate synthase MoaC [Gammaproteobacteria bacterium]|nr:cyclic pyranopterin monophosphate synthase MoaC [Gammaproteobacteria bacterium]MDE0248055.1 cyclic pyranopterin monophosphate synthase MoaC [Gammaproteobacteria bacterium]